MRLRFPRPRDAAPPGPGAKRPAFGLAAVPLIELEDEARRRGYRLLALDAFADLEGREKTVSAAEERGRELVPLIQKLGDLARELRPAAEQVSGLAAENVRLRRTLAEHADDFTLVAASLMHAEFPEHCER